MDLSWEPDALKYGQLSNGFLEQPHSNLLLQKCSVTDKEEEHLDFLTKVAKREFIQLQQKDDEKPPRISLFQLQRSIQWKQIANFLLHIRTTKRLMLRNRN